MNNAQRAAATTTKRQSHDITEGDSHARHGLEAESAATGHDDDSTTSPDPFIPILLTVRDVEAALQLGRSRTYELIRTGELPAIRVGRSLRIPRAALGHWIEAKTRGGRARNLRLHPSSGLLPDAETKVKI